MESELSAVSLIGPWPESNEVKAGSLWANRTVVFYVMRRAGCPLCRKFGVELMNRESEFDKAGASLVVVVSQDVGQQAFALTAWKNGEVYIDGGERFKKAMGARVVSNSSALNPSVLCGGTSAACSVAQRSLPPARIISAPCLLRAAVRCCLQRL